MSRILTQAYSTKETENRTSNKKPWNECLLPLLVAVYVEGALDYGSPLQATNDKCVGPGSLCLHQLAF